MLEVCLIGGQHDGKTHFIPHLSLSPPVEAIGFHLSRYQFPGGLAFAMTINKSQGQSVNWYQFPGTCFYLGQFYVAIQRWAKY